MKQRRFRRVIDAVFDRLGTRPISLLVFAGSIVLLIGLEFGSTRHIEAPAVAHAPPVNYPAQIDSVVSTVLVRPGDTVVAGTPIATLSLTAVERELREVDAEVRRMERLAQLEQIRLIDQTDDRLRDLEAELRLARREIARAAAEEASRRMRLEALRVLRDAVAKRVESRIEPRLSLDTAEHETAIEAARLDRAKRLTRAERAYTDRLEKLIEAAPVQSPLAAPTADFYAAELALLQTRQENLRSQMATTTLVAQTDGRVSMVLPVGAAAPLGTSIVSVLPDQATEVVAYVPAQTDPAGITVGAAVTFVDPPHVCTSKGEVLRRGAMVEEAPEWVRSFFQMPVYGLPVYISIPEDCAFGVGQKLRVELYLAAEL